MTNPDIIAVEIPAGLEAIAPGYLSARRRECEILARLIASREFAQIHVLAHNMKGTGQSYGFVRLTELGAAMDISAKAGDVAALTCQLAELEQYLGRVSYFSSSTNVR